MKTIFSFVMQHAKNVVDAERASLWLYDRKNKQVNQPSALSRFSFTVSAARGTTVVANTALLAVPLFLLLTLFSSWRLLAVSHLLRDRQ